MSWLKCIMQKIEKKVWPEYFEEILKGKKTFELRLNDFDINEGDILILKEWDPKTKDYTGRELEKNVGYVSKWKINELTKFWTMKDIEDKGLQVISLMEIHKKFLHPLKNRPYDFWFQLLSLLVTLITLCVLLFYTYYTKTISEEAIKTNQVSSQPFLVLLNESEEPYKIFNNGKGPALNVLVVEKINGKLMITPEGDILAGVTVNGNGQIIRKHFIETNKNKVMQEIPQLREMTHLFNRTNNWICLIYEDLFGNKFVSIHNGKGNNISTAIEFRQLK